MDQEMVFVTVPVSELDFLEHSIDKNVLQGWARLIGKAMGSWLYFAKKVGQIGVICAKLP